jgi:signal peptidase I
VTEKRFSEQGFETGVDPEGRPGRPSSRAAGGFLKFVIILAVSLALVFGFVRPFIVASYWVPSESMVPTLEVGDRIFVSKFIYRFTEPERGGIVVFKDVEGGEVDLIKRVVGVPGDEVEVRSGTLLVNGEPQNEPYLNREIPDDSFFGPSRLSEGEVFVMGDNRANSADSRVFGPLPVENIEGEAFMRFWPPTRIGALR